MRTKLTVSAIVIAVLLGCLGIAAALMLTLGVVPGLAVGLGIAAVIIGSHLLVLRRWMGTWGATDREVARDMPGDSLIPDGASTTRAISIDAPPTEVWAWIVQIGFGRAGWYSYDWIDNDGRPSAERIIPKHQGLGVGDRIVMVPGMGPTVVEIAPRHHFVAAGDDESSWCLQIVPEGSGSRLISRWRQAWKLTPANAFWLAIVEPGAFIMERKMLLGIKRRAEASAGRVHLEDRLAA